MQQFTECTSALGLMKSDFLIINIFLTPRCNLPVTIKSKVLYFDYTRFSQTSETRKVIQYHFTGWPDHGIPDTMELVEFHRIVMNMDSPQSGPLLVHCR